MITDEMRTLMQDEGGRAVAKAYLDAIEREDLSALGSIMADGVELTHANYPPVDGREEAVKMIEGYLRIVDAVEFKLRTLVGVEDLIVIEKVNIAAAPNGGTAHIRVVTIIEHRDGLISSIRIYADTGDLFRKLDARH